MLTIATTRRFKKDINKIKKSGNKDLQKLKEIISKLAAEIPLDKKYKPHMLKGNWQDHMECHIEPDWLLIYRIDNSHQRIILVRTGSHSELF